MTKTIILCLHAVLLVGICHAMSTLPTSAPKETSVSSTSTDASSTLMVTVTDEVTTMINELNTTEGSNDTISPTGPPSASNISNTTTSEPSGAPTVTNSNATPENNASTPSSGSHTPLPEKSTVIPNSSTSVPGTSMSSENQAMSTPDTTPAPQTPASTQAATSTPMQPAPTSTPMQPASTSTPMLPAPATTSVLPTSNVKTPKQPVTPATTKSMDTTKQNTVVTLKPGVPSTEEPNNSPAEGSNTKSIVVGLVVTALLIVLIVGVLIYFRQRRLRNSYGRLNEETEDSGWSAFSKNPIYRGDRDYQPL